MHNVPALSTRRWGSLPIEKSFGKRPPGAAASSTRIGEWKGETVLTVKEAAKRMSVSAATVYSLCATRQLRHTRIGLGRGKIVITEEAVDEYLKGREVGPASPEPISPPRPPVKLRHLHLPS